MEEARRHTLNVGVRLPSAHPADVDTDRDQRTTRIPIGWCSSRPRFRSPPPEMYRHIPPGTDVDAVGLRPGLRAQRWRRLTDSGCLGAVLRLCQRVPFARRRGELLDQTGAGEGVHLEVALGR